MAVIPDSIREELLAGQIAWVGQRFKCDFRHYESRLRAVASTANDQLCTTGWPIASDMAKFAPAGFKGALSYFHSVKVEVEPGKEPRTSVHTLLEWTDLLVLGGNTSLVTVQDLNLNGTLDEGDNFLVKPAPISGESTIARYRMTNGAWEHRQIPQTGAESEWAPVGDTGGLTPILSVVEAAYQSALRTHLLAPAR